MLEKRAHARYQIRLSAEVITESRRFTCTTRDVSAGGCCIEGAYQLPEGSEVDLALFLVVDGIEEEAMPPLKVRASVQWTAEQEEAGTGARRLAGLRFAALTPAQAQWLTGVLARCM
jgi:hypothetical protein